MRDGSKRNFFFPRPKKQTPRKRYGLTSTQVLQDVGEPREGEEPQTPTDQGSDGDDQTKTPTAGRRPGGTGLAENVEESNSPQNEGSGSPGNPNNPSKELEMMDVSSKQQERVMLVSEEDPNEGKAHEQPELEKAEPQGGHKEIATVETQNGGEDQEARPDSPMSLSFEWSNEISPQDECDPQPGKGEDAEGDMQVDLTEMMDQETTNRCLNALLGAYASQEAPPFLNPMPEHKENEERKIREQQEAVIAARPLHEEDPRRFQSTIDPSTMRVRPPCAPKGVPQVPHVTAARLDNTSSQTNATGRDKSHPLTNPAGTPGPPHELEEQHMLFLGGNGGPKQQKGPQENQDASGAVNADGSNDEDGDDADFERTQSPPLCCR